MRKYSKIKKILFSLCNAGGISGDEAQMLSVCKKLLPDFAEVTADCNGNILAYIGNKNAERTIIFDAHIDRVGMRVTNIAANGFLRVAKCGGIDARVLQGSAVTVFGKREIPAIIASTPPHLSKGGEDKAEKVEKLWVDTGLTEQEVKELVDIGSPVSFCGEPKTLLNNRVNAVGTDNRAGAAALIRTSWLLEEKNINDKKIILLFSSGEEVNARGAKTASFAAEARECISVDVSFAKQPLGGYATPGILGKGPMLCISSMLDRAITQKLKAIAEKEKIPYQIEVCAGATGTNADHISTSRGGIRTALLSIPQENMHTQAEIVDLSDIEALAQLLAEYAQRGEENV